MRAFFTIGAVLFGLSSSPAVSACYTPSRRVANDQVGAFIASPSSLLSAFPDGGAALSSRVRDLVESDPATLKPMIALTKSETGGKPSAIPSQVSAIGAGLGSAALGCASRDQSFATEIQASVAGAGNQDLADSYSSVTGDVAIGAGGGGGGGSAGGSVGGETSTNGLATGGAAATPAVFGTNTRTNIAPSLSFPGVGGISAVTGSTQTYTSQTFVVLGNASVSPH